MRNPRQGVIPTELAWLIDELDSLGERLKTLEAPSGEALSSTVAKLTALIADIQAQLDAWVASRWTNAEIVAQITSQINSKLAGSVTIGGAGTISGAATFGSTITSPVTYSTDIGSIPGARRTLWVKDSGLFGFASSSRERKTEIRPADFDVEAILSIEPKVFRYREAVRRWGEMPEDERGPEPGLEVGFIAEELDDAGLGAFVFYDGEGRPEGIEYSMLVVAQQAALRDLAARLDRLENDR